MCEVLRAHALKPFPGKLVPITHVPTQQTDTSLARDTANDAAGREMTWSTRLAAIETLAPGA